MSSIKPRILQHLEYEREAEKYLRSLPPEHFMEAESQGTQRAITLASLAVVRVYHPNLHVFNEMLVQYPKGDAIIKVVPDNMGVLYEGELRVTTNYGTPFQPVGPFIVFEYVSKGSERKDYEESFRKYEQDLRVPYYLLFYPDNQELTLYRHNGQRYVTVLPDDRGRRAIPDLELEVGLLDGWLRFWDRGELVPLPDQLVRELAQYRRQAEEATRRAEEEARRAAEEARRAEEAMRQASEAMSRAEEEAGLRAEATQRAQEATRRAEEEARLRQALEQEVARLRAQLGQSGPPGSG
jgi:Uma2 family endonuclease